MARLHALALLLATGCVSPEPPAESVPKALVIGLDGVRSDALEVAATPEIDALMASGAWTLDGTTQLTGPTVSGPGWTSILTGFEVVRHGIVNNDGWASRVAGTPTWLKRAHDAGIPTAAAIHWAPILTGLLEEGSLDQSALGADDEVAGAIQDLVGAGEHALHFVHLDDVDAAGHSTGFSPENAAYLAAIEAQDARIGRMLRAVEARPEGESWLIGVTTDHGGSGTSHGPLDEENRRIPVILSGAGRDQGELEGGGAWSHMDPMTTAAHHVGVVIDERWDLDGRVVPKSAE